MTVQNILDIQIMRRIRILERSIFILSKEGAPERTLAQMRKTLKNSKRRLIDKSEYEQMFPGLLRDEVLTWTEKPAQYGTVQFKTAAATYTFMPVSGRLVLLKAAECPQKVRRPGMEKSDEKRCGRGCPKA